MTRAIGDARVDEPTEALVIHRDQFPEMIQHCPTVIETLVHAMLDRASNFSSTNWQDEKMLSLGRLAAGLAHELNNPASAAMRSATLMRGAMQDVSAAAHALGAMRLTEVQRACIAAMREQALMSPTNQLSSIERSDREDEIAAWLDRHRANMSEAFPLAESAITLEALDQLAELVTEEALDLALRWIAAECTANSLASDIQRATSRIYDLVGAAKRFTFMDRASGMVPTHIAQGLADTVAVLATKAKEKSVAVRLEVEPDIPPVSAIADELNQVWSHLLENALDAVGPNGTVIVRAVSEGDSAIVRVIDDGPGIPPDVEPRIFDAFFTTKPVGQGMGLGLDIVRRIMLAHEGQVAVDTRPGRTEFCVTLPIDREKSA